MCPEMKKNTGSAKTTSDRLDEARQQSVSVMVVWGAFVCRVSFTVLVLFGLGHGLPVPGPLNDKRTTNVEIPLLSTGL